MSEEKDLIKIQQELADKKKKEAERKRKEHNERVLRAFRITKKQDKQ